MANKGICGDWEDHGFSTRKKGKKVIMTQGLKIGFRNTFAVTGSDIVRKTRPVE